jgi:hypothetical protein
MGQPKLVAIVGVMIIAIAGCASEETPPVATSPAVSPTVNPTVSPTTAASPQASPGTQPGNPQPLTSPSPSAPAVSGLIQPTNPQERARQVQTEIKANQRNPFAGLPPNIPVTSPPESKPVPKVAILPTQPGAGTPKSTGGGAANPGTTAQGKPVAKPSGTPKKSGSSVAKAPSAKPPVAVLPPKPSTAAADGMAVTGVITIGRTPQAILVAPGGATQYVGVGQRIYGGRVLVKRIENNYGDEPVVILEENGVEVAKSVGERPVTAGKQVTS